MEGETLVMVIVREEGCDGGGWGGRLVVDEVGGKLVVVEGNGKLVVVVVVEEGKDG